MKACITYLWRLIEHKVENLKHKMYKTLCWGNVYFISIILYFCGQIFGGKRKRKYILFRFWYKKIILLGLCMMCFIKKKWFFNPILMLSVQALHSNITFIINYAITKNMGWRINVLSHVCHHQAQLSIIQSL